MAADIATSLKTWSTTAASNQPDSTDNVSALYENLQTIQSVVRSLAAADTIASATTTDLGTKDAAFLTVSGTTTITGLGTVSAGIWKAVVFSGILTLTHNGTSLILPTAANITTAAGDCALFLSLGSGNWRCLNYMPASGAPVLTTGLTLTTVSLAGMTITSGPITEKFATATAGAGTLSITVSLLGGDEVTITGNITTLTLDNPSRGRWFTLEIIQGGSGSYTVGWAANIKWPGGVAPTLSTAVGKRDIFRFISDGTNWYGYTVGLNY